MRVNLAPFVGSMQVEACICKLLLHLSISLQYYKNDQTQHIYLMRRGRKGFSEVTEFSSSSADGYKRESRSSTGNRED